jgi:CHASE3 domain sensor protein
VRKLGPELDYLQTATARSADTHARVLLLRAATGAKVDEMDETVRLTKQGDTPKGLALVRTGKGEALMASVRRLAEGIAAEEGGVLAARADCAGSYGSGAPDFLTGYCRASDYSRYPSRNGAQGRINRAPG